VAGTLEECPVSVVEPKVQTWSHQLAAIEYLNSKPHVLLDCIMGCGKTYITIQNLRLVGTQGTKRTLILCPSAVLGVWRRETEKHAPGEFDTIILDGKENSNKKAEKAADAIRLQRANLRPLIIVVNYESFWRDAIWKVLNSVQWEKVVCDEIHRIKSHAVNAKASKHAWQIGRMAGSRTGLTGTFLPNDPGDGFAQYRFLDEGIFGKYWTRYRNRYAIMNQYIPQKVDKWIELEELHRKFNLIRHYISSDVLVLPDRQDIQIDVKLSPAGMKIYKEMRKESIVQIRKVIEDRPDEVRTAVASNGAVQFLRLLQLAQGFVNDDTKTIVTVDSEKRKVLMDLLIDCGEPVCVYGWFKEDLAIVSECCRILGLRYGEISGARKDLTPHATMPDNIDVMGIQAKSGSAGIDLTRSRIGIELNSGMLSPGDYDQMRARQHRPGQTKNVVWYRLVSVGTVETKLIDSRGKKRDLVDVLLNEMEEEVF